jgi:hypothetical protein
MERMQFQRRSVEIVLYVWAGGLQPVGAARSAEGVYRQVCKTLLG